MAQVGLDRLVGDVVRKAAQRVPLQSRRSACSGKSAGLQRGHGPG